jgi:hypothetical protein
MEPFSEGVGGRLRRNSVLPNSLLSQLILTLSTHRPLAMPRTALKGRELPTSAHAGRVMCRLWRYQPGLSGVEGPSSPNHMTGAERVIAQPNAVHVELDP